MSQFKPKSEALKALEKAVDRFASMDKITMNNATALLEECIVNGKKGRDYLYAWFLGEQHLIETTVLDLNEIVSPKDD